MPTTFSFLFFFLATTPNFEQSTPKEHHSHEIVAKPENESQQGGEAIMKLRSFLALIQKTPTVAAEGAEGESDADAAGDDEEMNTTQDGTERDTDMQVHEEGEQAETGEAKTGEFADWVVAGEND